MQAVVNPLRFAAVEDETGRPQRRQMPRHFGLDFTQSMGHLADTDFLFRHHQHQATQSSGVGQGLEKAMSMRHEAFDPHIRMFIYTTIQNNCKGRQSGRHSDGGASIGGYGNRVPMRSNSTFRWVRSFCNSASGSARKASIRARSLR